MTFSVVLTMPPSANASYRNVTGIGRARTKAYRDWRNNAVLSIFAQVRADKRVSGRCAITIEIPSSTRLDLDNALKPIIDALVKSNRIDDDRHVWAIHATRAAVAMPLVTVEGIAS